MRFDTHRAVAVLLMATAACAPSLESNVARPPTKLTCDQFVVEEDRVIADDATNTHFTVDRDGVPHVVYLRFDTSGRRSGHYRHLTVVNGRWASEVDFLPEDTFVSDAFAGDDGVYLRTNDHNTMDRSRSREVLFRGAPWVEVAALPMDRSLREIKASALPEDPSHDLDATRLYLDGARVKLAFPGSSLHDYVTIGDVGDDLSNCPRPTNTTSGWEGRTCTPKPTISRFERPTAFLRSRDVVVIGSAWLETSDATWITQPHSNGGWSRGHGKSGRGTLVAAIVTPARKLRTQELPVTFDELPAFQLAVDRFDRVHVVARALGSGHELRYVRLGCGG